MTYCDCFPSSPSLLRLFKCGRWLLVDSIDESTIIGTVNLRYLIVFRIVFRSGCALVNIRFKPLKVPLLLGRNDIIKMIDSSQKLSHM